MQFWTMNTVMFFVVFCLMIDIASFFTYSGLDTEIFIVSMVNLVLVLCVDIKPTRFKADC